MVDYKEEIQSVKSLLEIHLKGLQRSKHSDSEYYMGAYAMSLLAAGMLDELLKRADTDEDDGK